ncbi:CLUMA_CG001613, isoform A [Clunio marinus]|uniref:CLUMA_CG001613, isoform A n=1 Tax=Clunio marinus TaxID=568069 RepID=A0A1J1HNL5_9DIPT|nr:CLUMA_CG001613, isoform A [Clunio marinus]
MNNSTTTWLNISHEIAKLFNIAITKIAYKSYLVSSFLVIPTHNILLLTFSNYRPSLCNGNFD